jgi:peptidoglycan/LPS O-acetylase OafA/YrhL
MHVQGSAVSQEARVFHTLDALRGIAAIAVVVFHMQRFFAPVAAPSGYLAVDLFFMMSGVVLSHAYEGRFQAGMGTLEFMRVRFVRLYPLYLIGALLGIVVTLASFLSRNINHWDPSSLFQAALLALLFLPDFSTRPVNELFPLNIPCWSLFLEILVNLLFVICWPLLTVRRLIAVSLLTGVTVGWAIVHTGSIDQGSTVLSFPVGLVRTVFGFSVGVLIARRISNARRKTSNLKALAIVVVIGIAITGGPQGELRAVWDAVCVLVVIPLMVYCGTLVDPGRRLQKFATFLGLTSYAVYVLHSPLSAILNSQTRFRGSGTGIAVGAPYMGVAVLALLLAGCWLVDRHVDMPIRRRLSRVLPKMRRSARSHEHVS